MEPKVNQEAPNRATGTKEDGREKMVWTSLSPNKGNRGKTGHAPLPR